VIDWLPLDASGIAAIAQLSNWHKGEFSAAQPFRQLSEDTLLCQRVYRQLREFESLVSLGRWHPAGALQRALGAELGNDGASRC